MLRSMAKRQPKYKEMKDTPPEVQRIHYEIIRKIPLGRRLGFAFDACEMGRQIAMAGLRMRHPAATEKELWWLWAHQHLGQELFDRIYGSPSDG
jgi:hypothetical protein